MGKTAIVGMKDRETGEITTKPVESTARPTLRGFVLGQIEPGANGKRRFLPFTPPWA